MKKTLLLFGLFISLAFQINAQDDVACVPDPAFADSNQVVFPLPLLNGTGGIEMFPACIGEPYDLVFSFRIGDSAVINGFPVDLVEASIATTGGVTGLPEGLNYFCNPPDCIFPDTLLGCIVVKGTPTENNTVGVNPLIITAQVTASIFPQPITETIPGTIFPGEYNLVLNEAGGCQSVSTNDYLAQNIALGNSPNPVIDQTMIEVSSDISGEFQFTVLDVAGKLIHSEQIQLATGYNTFTYNAADLGAGMYIYAISNGTGAISKKMIVSK